jgi:hypothetical protein
MRNFVSSLSVLGMLAVLGSNRVLADLPPVDIGGQISPQVPFPAGGVVFEDAELIGEHAEGTAKPEPMHTDSSCFPALNFVMPPETPAHLSNWWCNATDEYAFLGFSYEVTACGSTVAFVY